MVENQHPKYKEGDIVVYNPTGEFDNIDDELFHIHSLRFGICTNVRKEQYWYSGSIMQIRRNNKDGMIYTLGFKTTLTNAAEGNLKGIEGLSLSREPNQTSLE